MWYFLKMHRLLSSKLEHLKKKGNFQPIAGNKKGVIARFYPKNNCKKNNKNPRMLNPFICYPFPT
jgi:hypothetical protein